MNVNFNTQKEIELFLKDATAKGFNFGYSYEIHKNKLANIIQNANKLNIKCNNDSLIKEFFVCEYSDFENKMQTYFNQFDETYKIYELANMIGLGTKMHRNTAEYDKLISKGFTDLGLNKRDWQLHWFCEYDFTKSIFKLHVNDRNVYEFNKLVKLLGFDFEVPYYHEYSNPKVWETENFKIQKNKNTVEIKNVQLVAKLKEIYTKLLKEPTQNKTYVNYIVKFN